MSDDWMVVDSVVNLPDSVVVGSVRVSVRVVVKRPRSAEQNHRMSLVCERRRCCLLFVCQST